jgi:cytoskeletal protein CcmA (bactofilin family)
MTANVKESAFIKGELTVEEDLTVEGRVEGKIELKDHNLWIGPQGKVYAEIHAKSVIIAGDVIGNIFAREIVEIRLSGSVLGNINCSRISILDGAKFNGSIDTDACGRRDGARVAAPQTTNADNARALRDAGLRCDSLCDDVPLLQKSEAAG